MPDVTKIDPAVASLLQDVEMLFAEVIDCLRGRETPGEIEEHLRIFRQRRVAATPEE